MENLFNSILFRLMPVYEPHSPSNVRNFVKQTFNLLIELRPGPGTPPNLLFHVTADSVTAHYTIYTAQRDGPL